jgi:type I restriction-modification system DNA methylase subunit
MQDEGLLFSVLPRSTLVKQSKYRLWRVDLLANNTLLAVVDFPEDLFYPIGVQSCGIIIKKGVPHPHEQNVLWVKINTDGLLKAKANAYQVVEQLTNLKIKRKWSLILSKTSILR